jgi:acyl carrier protein
LKQDWEHFSKPFAPKVDGAWNLHELSLQMSLDFFVLFSSVASILGSYHQASYAAANSFLDTLAHYRKSKGLAATAINWGPWSKIGMASKLDDQIKQRFSIMGIDSIPPEQGLEALTQILIDKPAQVAVLPLQLPVLLKSPVMNDRELLSELYLEITQSSKADSDKQKHQVLLILKSVSKNEHEKIMIDFLTEQVTKVLKLDLSESPKPNQALFDLGMDSLMAVELKNRIDDNLGISISPSMTFEYPTIAALAKYLTDLVQPLIESTSKTRVESLESISLDDNLTSVIENMSEVELDAMIAQELNKNIPLNK